MGSIRPAPDANEAPYLVTPPVRAGSAPTARAGDGASQAALDDIKALHDDFQRQNDASGRAAAAYLAGSLTRDEFHDVRGRNAEAWRSEVDALASQPGRAADLQAALAQTYGASGGASGWPAGEAAVGSPDLQVPGAGPAAGPAHVDDVATSALRQAVRAAAPAASIPDGTP